MKKDGPGKGTGWLFKEAK